MRRTINMMRLKKFLLSVQIILVKLFKEFKLTTSTTILASRREKLL